MKKDIDATFFILLVTLLLSIGYAWLYIMKKENPIEMIFEGYEGAPMRAMDCRCLTGYVPSKTINSPFGGKVIKFKNDIHFIPSGTNTRFYVPNCMMCGSDLNFCTNAKQVDESEFKQYKQANKVLDCSIWNNVKGKKETEAYFCQKLGSPTETMFCY